MDYRDTNDGNYQTVHHQQHCRPDSIRLEHGSQNTKKLEPTCSLCKETSRAEDFAETK